MSMRLYEIARVLGSPVLNDSGDFEISSFAIDSRAVGKGDIFVCVPGERADGHDFAGQAQERGAGAILAERPVDCGLPVILTENTVKALGKLAFFWRDATRAKVIAITGTAGKTTLKETLYYLLSENGKTERAYKNHNNQIGLPLSILNMDRGDKYWILEAGISQAGDMDELGEIARPDMGVILNIGPGHEEGLVEQGVAWNKARLLAYVKPDGAGVLSRDYPQLLEEAARYAVPEIFFGVDKPGQYAISEDPKKPGLYFISGAGKKIEVETPFSGDYGAENVICAYTCAAELGLDDGKIIKGFKNLRLPEQRFNKSRRGNFTIIDDCYNANPLSMERMLNSAFRSSKTSGGKFIAVLGAMRELGGNGAYWHNRLGRQLAKLQPELVFWKGDFLEDVQAGYADVNKDGKITPLNQENAFAEKVMATAAGEPAIIFFKGSRANHLERYLNYFLASLDNRGSENVL